MPTPVQSPILLILGAGPRIGNTVAAGFASKGYRVALVSRNVDKKEDTPDRIHIAADLADPEAVSTVFERVRSVFGEPSVVVYNAGAFNRSDPADPLANISPSALTKSLTVNTVNVWAAAQEAVKSFAARSSGTATGGTFIFTGNCLNFNIIPFLLDGGMGKSATSHLIRVLAGAYKDKGYKFYYADERKDDGSAAFGDVSGEAAADFYPKLAEDKEQHSWLQTFVKSKGYVKFPVPDVE